MNRIWRAILMAAAVIFISLPLLSSAALAADGAPVAAASPAISKAARIGSIEGEVTFKTAEADPWSKAADGQDLPEGAFVMTAFESSCVIDFADGSKMKVRELSKVCINKFSAGLGKVDAGVTLYNGTVRATVHKDVDKDTKFNVKTPTATISVRGTEKEISSFPGFGTNVSTIAGLVEVTNHIGQSTVIAKDQSTSVPNEKSQPSRLADAYATGAKKSFMKNESLTPEEDEARFLLMRPGYDAEAAMMRDLFEISVEKHYYPTSYIDINW